MSITPPSERSEFQGFSDYYDDEIASYLRGKEDARQTAVMQAGLVAIATAVLAFAAFRFAPFGDGNVQAAIFTGMAGSGIALWRINKTRNDITHGLLERVCRQLDFLYRQHP